MNGSDIHSPSFQFLPHRKHVVSHPYHGVKNSIIRVRFLQSGQFSACIFFAVACGAQIPIVTSSVPAQALRESRLVAMAPPEARILESIPDCKAEERDGVPGGDQGERQ